MTASPLSYGPFISRSQAMARGLKSYYTGKPCKHGHVSPQKVGGGCPECANSQKRQRRAKARKEAESHINPWECPFHRYHVPARYYTYAYLRPDGRPFYIGKGIGTRAWDAHSSNKRKRVWNPPTPNLILIMKWDLTEAEAFAHEARMISIYGSNGFDWLTMNFTEGGEGASGRVKSEEEIAGMSQRMQGNTFGANVAWTPELRAKLSAALKGVKKTITPKLKQAYESKSICYHWEHPQHGKRSASCTEMAKETGYTQAEFWRCKAGLMGQTHGWVCLDPEKAFKAKDTDHVARIGKAAATRVAKNAAELGMTVEQYNSMSYQKRSQIRKQMRELQAA